MSGPELWSKRFVSWHRCRDGHAAHSYSRLYGHSRLFNETLRWRSFPGDATIGIDADGYRIAGRRNSIPHIACIKGVLADATRFERGGTRLSMALQSRLEAKHAQRADLVVTISQYCAERLEELYGVKNSVVVPE